MRTEKTSWQIRRTRPELSRVEQSKPAEQFHRCNADERIYAALIRFSELRTESILKQVNGRLESRSDIQTEEYKVDASEISIYDMGSVRDLDNPVN